MSGGVGWQSLPRTVLQLRDRHPTPSLISLRSCEPTLPLQGRVKANVGTAPSRHSVALLYFRITLDDAEFPNYYHAVPFLPRGRLAIVTIRGAGCCGRERGARRANRRVRRNRDVLSPRRWCQVCEDKSQATVAIELISPGRPRISRKTIVRGMPGVPVCPWRCCAFFAAGASAPGFPAPSFDEGGIFLANLGRNVSRDRGVMFLGS
jgi:hypothetical protein